ncbi:MAG: TonB-dependent receptor [Flavobacteriaceae bacterium]|nr:TonB-dependent receptor [Flavobacteriaceae bacterium]MBD10902.1 TonB-dependent receptor [Flavobacteriaceae bacterium]|tara:strand:+ start:883 stop:3369 length:2487 start_codon:yes stop_codon:yes gene_type:complete
MKLNLTLLVILLFNLSLSFAQKDIKIEGKVIEEGTNIPLEYATITLKSTSENKVVTGGITDTDGKFSIEIPSGTYNIYVEYISYITKEYLNKTLTTSIDLGTVSLALDIASLDEVTVVAERTTVEIKLDKKIYNVGKDLTVRGGTVSDVLDNVPSVSVDVEGAVSLRGNDDVRILINGKPSGLVGLNSTDALRQLPAESIERVEVITSPSARYDAEGSAGILNIILRRSKLEGLNGAVTVNGGYPWQAGISGNINYRTGDVNIFNTTSYDYRESPGNATNETEYFNGDEPSTFLTEDRDFDRIRKGYSTNTGIEWYINETSSITASLVYRDSDNESNTFNLTREFDSNNTLINTTIRRDPELEDDKTIQYALSFDKQFNGDSQHKLTFDFQYEDSREIEQSIINQNGFDVEFVETDENQDRILLQADYVKPINETGQFELGYRGEFFDLYTDYLVESSFDNGDTFQVNTNLSNALNFKQYVNAFYTQFGNKIGEKFSYLLGLRYEGTRITIDQVTSSDFNKKDYHQLFPTVNLAFELSENENITLGYNRRIRRPRSRFINPFPSRSSATNLFQGNPDLDPSTSNAFDVGYFKKFGKLSLTSSIYFQRAKDAFNFVALETDNFYIYETNQTININDPNFDQLNEDYDLVPVIKRTPINLATNDRFGLEFTLTYRPTKKWNLNGNFNLFNSSTRGDYEGQNFDADNISWFIRLNNKYTLPGNIDWQTRLFYRGPSETAQSKNKGIFSTDLAFSKDLFKDKASIAFNVRDLFNSRKRRSDNFTDTFNNYSEFQWRVRSFNLAFTYRFNQQNKRERGDRGGEGGGDNFDFEG